jgi:hypothetical protein
MRYTYDQLAGMIDHSLLHPTMTDRDLREGPRRDREGDSRERFAPERRRQTEALSASGRGRNS